MKYSSSRVLVLLLLSSITILSIDDAFAIDKLKRTETKINVVKKDKRKAAKIAARSSVSKADIYGAELEKQLISEMKKTIGYLTKQAKRQKKRSNLRFQFLEKSMNLYVEYAILQRNQEEKAYDVVYERWIAKGSKNSPPKLDTRRSTRAWLQVINYSKQIFKEYPKAPNADLLIYNQAFALDFLGQRKKSAGMYSQLVKRFPKSNIAGEAYFALGEYFFDGGKWRNAITNYKQAIRYRKSKRYGWAMFKYAWSLYNLNKYSSALKAWKRVVSYSNTQGSKGIRLKEEAMRDMVYAYAETQDINGAIAYYRANGGQKYIGQMLKLLSQTLADQGKYSQAIKVAKRLQRVEPNSPEAPAVQKFIIETAGDLGRYSMLWSELMRYGEDYGPKSSWYQRNRSDRKLVLNTQKDIRDTMIYYAKVTHKSAQDSDNRETHLQAKKGYLMFLRYYPSAKESAEIKYNMADIEYYLKNYRTAGQLYMQIGSLGPKRAVIVDPATNKVLANIHQKSASYMMDAYGKDYENEFKALSKKKPNFDKPARRLSAKAKNYIRSCLLYMKWYPKDKKVKKTCDLDIAQIYYKNSNKKLSKKYLWAIAKDYSKDKEGAIAVDQLIPLYKDDKVGLATAVAAILKIPAYQKGELGKKLTSLKRGTEIEAIVAMKDISKRARAYEKAAKANPRAEDADKLWYNAAVDHIKSGDVQNAMKNYAIIVRNYPKSEQYRESIFQLAKLHEKRFEYADSIKYLKAIVKKYPKDKGVLAARAKVCELGVGLGKKDAWTNCVNFSKYDRTTANFYLQRIVEDAYRNKKNATVKALTTSLIVKQKLSPAEMIAAYYRVYDLGGSNPRSAPANSILSTYNRAKGDVDGEALRYVGEINFKRADVKLSPYLSLGLRGGTVEALLASIQNKTKALQKVQSSYDTVFKTKDSFWGVAALHQIAYAYEQFYKKLENPPSIKGAAIADVKKELAPQVEALRKEAVQRYKLAWESAQKFNVYSRWTSKVFDGLNRVMGKEIDNDFYVVTPDFISSEIPSDLIRKVR